MTTPDPALTRRAAIRAERHHANSLTPSRALENILDELVELFPHLDRQQVGEDAERLRLRLDGDYVLVVDEIAFKIEVKLKGAK